jgi:hypothetical protein
MVHVTVAARRTVVWLLTLAGGYYTVVGASALLNLGEVTRRWTRLSGDPDFPADAAQFGILIGTGAAIWVVLGIVTMLFGLRTSTGGQVSRASWAVLTTIAVVVHVPWLLYRSIGTGALPGPEATLEIRVAGLQFATVALLYIVAMLATRHGLTRRAAG